MSGSTRVRARCTPHFEIRNDSAETWRAAEGFGVGYHLFDADTGTLIVDGARVHPEQDVKPGETAHGAPGRSRCPGKTAATRCCSRRCAKTSAGITSRAGRSCWWRPPPRTARRAWTACAWPPARRSAGSARCAAIGRAFVYPFSTVWRNRGLIRVMVRRDILGRYRGSFGGAFWTIINPLLLMLTYFFVFGVVLRDRYDPQRHAGRASRSTSWRACCRGWRSARPPDGLPA